MKIGFVLDDTLDSTDGVQQYVLALGGWTADQGHTVAYLVGMTSRTDIPGIRSLSRNIKVNFNGNRMSIPLPVNRRRIKNLLDAEKFDILHVQMPYSPALASRIILAAPARTAVVATFHIAPHSKLVSAANVVLAGLTLRSRKRIDCLLSVSTAAQNFARTAYHHDSAILPNVVDIDRFTRSVARPRSTESLPTIVFLGRLVERKGCQLLLEAAARLRLSDPKLGFRITICGRGPLETELQRYVSDHGLTQSIDFAGFISESDKPAYLRAADLAVFPSSGGESFGIVLLEAMAANHPVVLAADNPGYHSVLAPRPEQLFPVNDSQALADKIKHFLTHPAAVTQARSWQQHYVPQFATQTVGEKLLQIYQKTLSDRQETIS